MHSSTVAGAGATRRPASKKPTKALSQRTAAKSFSPEVQEIIRLARKLKGAFGPA